MIRGRIRAAVEAAAENLADNHPDGFSVEWLRTSILKNGIRRYTPSAIEIGHFLSTNRVSLRLEHVGQGRWARAETEDR